MAIENKIASLDIGANTVTMLIAQCEKGGIIDILDEFGGASRLVEKLTETKRISKDAEERTFELIKEVIEIAANYGVEKIITTATSSLKNADNKTEFLLECQNRFKIFPQILSEKDEALYIYRGTTIDYLKFDNPLIVIETGGLNTQIAYGTKDLFVGSYTIDVGHLSSLFLVKNKILSFYNQSFKNILKTEILRIIDELLHWLNGRKPIVICSGNITITYAKTALFERCCTREKTNTAKSDIKEMEFFADKVLKMSVEKRAEYLELDINLANTFYNGLYLIAIILRLLGIDTFNITANSLRTGVIRNYISSFSI